jgi:hypothetical protein
VTANPAGAGKPGGDQGAAAARATEDSQEAIATRAAEIAIATLAQAQFKQMAAAPPPTWQQMLPHLLPPIAIAAVCVGMALFLSFYRMPAVDIVLEVERAEAVQFHLAEPLDLGFAPGEKASFTLEGPATVVLTDTTTRTKSTQTERLGFETARDNTGIRIGAGAMVHFRIDVPYIFSPPRIEGVSPPLTGTARLRIDVQGGGFGVSASPVTSVTDADGADVPSIDHLAWQASGSPATITLESGMQRRGFLHVDLLRTSMVAFSRSVVDTGKSQGPTTVCTLGKGKLRFVDLIGDPIQISARTCLRISLTTAQISDLAIDDTISFVLRGRVTDISIIDPSRGKDATASLMPTLMQFILSDRSLNSQWLIVVFLWGAIWSAIRLAVSGKLS